MSEMKAALLYGDRDLRVQQIEKPQAGDNGVLVKVKAVGVCGTDLHAYKMGMFKEMSLPQADGSVLFGLGCVQVIVALYEKKLNIDLNQVVSKNLQVTGTLGYTEEQINVGQRIPTV